MPMFCFAALLIIKVILIIWKKYRQNTGNANLVGGSNYYFNKIFCCFNHLEVRFILHYIIYKSFVDSAQKKSQTASPQTYFLIFCSH